MVVIPSVEEEDVRRSHRERNRLVRERTAHINRIKGLLFGQGIRGINVKKDYKTLAPAALVTGDGREVYYRRFANRRQVASYIGLAPSPYDSGDGRRSQGISKAGNGLARYCLIRAAWLWPGHQPNSALTLWFQQRTKDQSKRVRCIMIVALARKLAIALWRSVELGLIPQGATLSAR